MAGPRPLHEQVEESYEQQASIQPSAGGISIKRVRVDKRNPQQRRDNQGRVVKDRRHRVGATSQVKTSGTKKPSKSSKSSAVKLEQRRNQMAANEEIVTGVASGRPPVRRVRRNFVGKRYIGAKAASKKIGGKGKVSFKHRRKATMVNLSILSWLGPSWFFFQLPFAILNIVFFGFLYIQLEAEDALAGSITARVLGFVFEVLRGVVQIVSLGTLDLGSIFKGIWNVPANFFLVTWGILIGYCIIVTSTMGILYTFNRLNPLFGEGSSLKLSTYLLCFIGYVIPGLNLFPWAVFWAAAVWKNPK